ncbi:MAG: hypothetical protein KAJ49_01455 [Arcobacteraceae bacterium]|nr:hypothetical protein [Arcobacteraceae bacterium]
MQTTIKTRAIPKKTIIIMVLLVLAGIATFFITENGKVKKATRVLDALGYKDIQNVKVYKVLKIENKDTKIQGFRYFVTFKNNETNQECKGYALVDFKKNTAEDISCKDIK